MCEVGASLRGTHERGGAVLGRCQGFSVGPRTRVQGDPWRTAAADRAFPCPPISPYARTHAPMDGRVGGLAGGSVGGHTHT